MRRAELQPSFWIASVCVLLAFACESTKQVGSACAEGVCPRASAVESSNCIVSATAAEIAITRAPADQPELDFEALLCLPRELPIDDEGRVACRVLWLIGENDAEPVEGAAEPWRGSCSDLPFLEPDGETENACVVTQVTAEQAASGDGDGWYFDASHTECRDDAPALRFTAAAAPPSGVVVQVFCNRTQSVTEQGELVDVAPTECGELPDGPADDLGAACLPAAVPGGGYSDLESHLELGSPQCGTEACLVYHLLGDPQDPCRPDGGPGDETRCATDEEIEARAYCSCRCDAPPGDPGPLCECGEGFGCVEVFPDGVPGVRGSYCVRQGTFTPDD